MSSSLVRAEPVPQAQLRQFQQMALQAHQPLVVLGAHGSAPVRAADPALNLAAGQVLRVPAPLTTQRLAKNQLRILAPIRYVIVNAATHQLMTLAPVVIVEQGGLVMTGAGDEFASAVAIGIEDISGQGGTQPLPASTVIQLLVQGGTAAPGTITVHHTNAPFAMSQLSSASPPDNISLTVLTSFDPQHLVIPVPVRRPGIDLTVRKSLPGWGVGCGNVTVGLRQYPGSTPRRVFLTATRGTLSPDNVLVEKDQKTTLSYRSAGLDTATIQATSAGFVPASQPIALGLPIGFAVATLIGAALGSWLKAPSATGSKAWRNRTLSLLVGVVVAAFWALKVNLLPIGIPFDYNETSIALAGFCGAYASKVVLGKIGGTSGQGPARQGASGKRQVAPNPKP